MVAPVVVAGVRCCFVVVLQHKTQFVVFLKISVALKSIVVVKCSRAMTSDFV